MTSYYEPWITYFSAQIIVARTCFNRLSLRLVTLVRSVLRPFSWLWWTVWGPFRDRLQSNIFYKKHKKTWFERCVAAWQPCDPKYIPHSARNLIPDFERPLLAPQPTDFHFKHRSGRLQIAIFPIPLSKRKSGQFCFYSGNELQTQPRYT